MSIKRWVVPDVDKQAAAQLAEDCEIHPFLALMLVARGVTDADSAADFLVGGEPGDDPFAFADMDVAAERIQHALESNEMLAVYGDYDADGVTATVMLYSYLKEKGANVIYYVPEREGEGYGLHRESIDSLSERGARLIVTVDNGVSAADEIDYAAAKGIDVIVTDHHHPPAQLPRALAIVNPHRRDCGSAFKEYAGVGVAFKLISALEGDTDTVIDEYGDLIALGTLADVVPLTGENRKLVRSGLRILNQYKRPGIKALIKASGIKNDQLNWASATFTLVPRINAAGRMDTPDLAVRLLLADNKDEADGLAERIQQCNVLRQSAEAEILREITDRLKKCPELTADRVLVLDGENWHEGVIGIIAARIVERYGKPCILITKNGGEAKGSGRSIRGFSLYDAVSACAGVLSRFGGHEMAAGLGLPSSNIQEFRLRINEYAEKYFPEMPVPELRLDFKLRPSQIDVEKLNLISALEPFGAGNPAPVFGLFGMRLDNIMQMGGGKHLRLSVSRDNARFSVVRFNANCKNFPFECGQTVNLVVTLERNEYRGVVTPTVLLKDIRAAETAQEEIFDACRLFDSLLRNDEIDADTAASMMPDRKQLEDIYRFLRAKEGWEGTFLQLCFYLKDIPCIRILVALEILRQAGLMSYHNTGDVLEISLLPNHKKADLTSTAVWKRLSSATKRRGGGNE